MTRYIRIVTARILYRSSDDRKGYVEWFYKRVICRLALQNGCLASGFSFTSDVISHLVRKNG